MTMTKKEVAERREKRLFRFRERMDKISAKARADSELLASENIRQILLNSDVQASEKARIGAARIDQLIEAAHGGRI